MPITFRPVSEADKPYLTWLEEACMRVYAVALWGRWRPRPDEYLILDEHRMIVMDGKDVGCVAIRRCSDYLDVDKLYVAPGFQNRGIGSVVVKRVLAEAEGLGIPIRLSVLRPNPALAFYLRHGLHVVEETSERRLLSS